MDIEIQAREMAFLRRRMHEILAHHTGQSVERIEKDTDRDYILGGEDAVAYGLIDHVLTSRKLPLPVVPPTPQLDAEPSRPIAPAAPGIRPGEPVRLG